MGPPDLMDLQLIMGKSRPPCPVLLQRMKAQLLTVRRKGYLKIRICEFRTEPQKSEDTWISSPYKHTLSQLHLLSAHNFCILDKKKSKYLAAAKTSYVHGKTTVTIKNQRFPLLVVDFIQRERERERER